MHAEAHRKGRRSRWGLRLATVLSVLVLGASGMGHLLLGGLGGDIGRLDPFGGLTDRPEETGGVNFLVVGTDGRDKLSAEERQKYRLGGAACDCTDTLLLVHLSADHDRASIVSLPRDSYTRLPAHSHSGGERHPEVPAKLNSAYAHGGARLTVEAVESMTGVHVNHYLEVDFSSFMRTVDVLGGVPVCTREALHDDHSGLDLPAGTTTLDGGRALQYVRARHLGDGSDLGRMERQQHFLASVIEKATDSGMLMNPVKMRKVASTLLGSVRADSGLDTEQMLELARALREFDSDSSEFVSVPVADADYRVGQLGSTVRWDRQKAERLFDALRDDRPLTERPGGRGGKRTASALPAAVVRVPPEAVRVQVDNGTRRRGLAGRVERALRATGFVTTGVPGDSGREDVRRTSIAYDPQWNRSVRTLAKALPGARLVEEPGRGPVMGVTVGEKHHGVRKVRAESAAEEAPSGETGASGGKEKASCA